MITRALPMGLLLLAGACALGLRPLALFWRGNEEYFYGWGVPFLATYLFYERWRCRPEPAPRHRTSTLSLGLIIAVWALVFLATRLVLETEPASRPLLWFAACLFAGGMLAWTGLLGGRPWLRHFAFPIAFLLVGVPWIFRCELLVVQGLMRLNASWVVHALALLAIPARAAGNTIVLPGGQLGVSEACSGIRSLQAALMMALFFGEFYRYGTRGRVGPIAAGVALALSGNFTRMLYLAACGAMDGVAEVEAEHDSAGWVILVFTVTGLWLICLGTRRTMQPAREKVRDVSAASGRAALTWALGIFFATLFAEAATQGWYGWRESSAPHCPDWTVAWPESAPGYQRTELSGAVLRQLHYSTASQAEWRDATGWRWEGLWIRYRNNAEGKVVFESHNPGLCLPAVGWRALPQTHSFALRVGAIHLDAQVQSFESDKGIAHVFWVPYLDGGVRASSDQSRGLYGHALSALAAGQFPWLADVWAGCRGANAETLELAITGTTDDAQAEVAFRQLLPHLVRAEAIDASTLTASERQRVYQDSE